MRERLCLFEIITIDHIRRAGATSLFNLLRTHGTYYAECHLPSSFSNHLTSQIRIDFLRVSLMSTTSALVYSVNFQSLSPDYRV
jgi:hypothetical protein